MFDGLIGTVARELSWKLSGNARIGFVIAASWLGGAEPQEGGWLARAWTTCGPKVLGTKAPMKRRVSQRVQWPRSSDFASFLLLLLTLIGQHLSDTSRDLATLTLEVTVLVADAGLRPPSVYQVSTS